MVKNKPLSEMNYVSTKYSTIIVAHHIPAPASRPSCCKMRQTSSKTRHGLTRTETRRLDKPVHLHRAQCKIVHEIMSGRDKLARLLDNGTAGGLVRFEDDQGEVLGTHKGWAGGLDEVKASFEPSDRLGEAGKGLDLSEA